MTDPLYSREVVENRFGFFEVKHKPTANELKDFYSRKYFQESRGPYQREYSAAEITHIHNKIDEKFRIVRELLPDTAERTPRLLDVGCGEGWTLRYFVDRQWSVLGLEYSDFACTQHNPGMLEHVRLGDVPESLRDLAAQAERFDCIWLDNVLEHVPDPLGLLRQCHELGSDQSILVVEVPNDFSKVQQHLYENGYIDRQFWIAVPDHLSYFNKDGLAALGREAGWEGVRFLGDYPIDFHLFNSQTNYVADPSRGKPCHYNRVEVENLLHSISPEKTNELNRALADLGLGRQIIGIFRRAGG